MSGVGKVRQLEAENAMLWQFAEAASGFIASIFDSKVSPAEFQKRALDYRDAKRRLDPAPPRPGERREGEHG